MHPRSPLSFPPGQARKPFHHPPRRPSHLFPIPCSYPLAPPTWPSWPLQPLYAASTTSSAALPDAGARGTTAQPRRSDQPPLEDQAATPSPPRRPSHLWQLPLVAARRPRHRQYGDGPEPLPFLSRLWTLASARSEHLWGRLCMSPAPPPEPLRRLCSYDLMFRLLGLYIS